MKLHRLVDIESTLTQINSEIKSMSIPDAQDELNSTDYSLSRAIAKLNQIIGKEFVKNKTNIDY